LSSPHLEASTTTTFRACCSPAPTRVKPQPAPAILSQESVHTTLSITHHTRKRPSTGSLTTYGPQRAAARPAAGVPPPVFDHKPTAGEPLVLPHLIPGRTRRRSRPIPASRPALHAQGLHCVSLFLSRVFFVNQGPSYNREKSSRGLP
jgi:hypothetical protein